MRRLYRGFSFSLVLALRGAFVPSGPPAASRYASVGLGRWKFGHFSFHLALAALGCSVTRFLLQGWFVCGLRRLSLDALKQA